MQGNQGYMFLMLTVVVMLVVVIMSKNLTTALLIISLLANFLVISTQVIYLKDRHEYGYDHGYPPAAGPAPSLWAPPPPAAPASSGFTVDKMVARRRPQDGRNGRINRLGARPDESLGAREKFTMSTTAPPGAGAPSFPNVVAPSAIESYPGAIDFGEGGPAAGAHDEAPALGHSDWDKKPRDSPPLGNPYDTDRIESPQGAAPCVDDDAIAIYDGDEQNTYQVRSRNDPERVWAGILRRKPLVERYVKEELDERENTRWWGDHEV